MGKRLAVRALDQVRPQHRAGGDEVGLVARARRGDEVAFGALYDRHSGAVHTVAVRLLVDRRDAEEATQDTFVSAWRHLDSFRGDSAFSTWIHRICVNRCTSILRRRRPVDVDLDRIALHPDPRPGPAAMAGLHHELGEVQAALAQLPEGSRVALVLREVAELSYEEVARVLGISLTAARSRIHRGRTALLDALDATDGEERCGA